MKRIGTVLTALALITAAASCSQRFELDIPLALNRAEMRFDASGNSYYVLVYCHGEWTASLDKDVPWVSLSRTSGSGNSQIMVTADLNRGVSRGVSLWVKSGSLSKEMYISQKSASADVGNFSLVEEGVEMLRGASIGRIAFGTDLDKSTLAGVETSVEYEPEDAQPWIHDIVIEDTRVTFRVDENTSGAARSATISFTFPLARWDTPVKASFKVNQSVDEPAEIGASLSALNDGTQPVWEEGDRLMLLDTDGSSTVPAEVYASGGAQATLLFNADAVQAGILGGAYPEDYIDRWSGGKVYIKMPQERPFVPTLEKAAHLAVLSGRKVGESVQFSAAGALLKLNLQGEGTLQRLSLLASSPISGDGTLDMTLEKPAYVPGTEGSPQIDIQIPAEGVALPATLYVAIPEGDLGSILISAVTSAWSGCLYGNAQKAGVAGDVIPMQEINFTIPSQAKDLTQGDAWANCFLVENQEQDTYSIDLRKPDGSKVTGAELCSILWQTTPGVIDYLAIDAATGKLYFRKSAANPGSAHVAVSDNGGSVKWSYHIWAPADSVETRRIGNYTFMDRNLGAVMAAATDFSNASIGMHYQWGRKDPFPPATGMAASGNGNRSKVYPDNIVFVVAQDGVTQEEADATPNTYYWGREGKGKQDWRKTQDDNLWAAAASNANPCPHGWKVASNDELGLLPERLKASEYVSKVGIVIKDDDNKDMLFVPGGAYRRTTHATSELANMSDGWIWSSTPCAMEDYRGSYRLWFQNPVNNRRIDTSYPQRRWGGNVRCVKVQ
ncbi:MAG: hypothetical protein K6F58_02965 [Bacteroidales bacterium]|nr:hypothetical protein [Bacteroidales bacterium]